MNLYEMLDRTRYNGRVYVVALSKQEDEHFLFSGLVQDAREDNGIWNYLMHKIDSYYTYRDVIVIKIQTKDTWHSFWHKSIETEIDELLEGKNEF